MQFNLKAILLVLTLLAGGSGATAQSQLSWSEGHVNALIPGQEVSAGYLRITNNGEQDETLVGFASAAAAMVQLHESSMSNGMMSMKHIESIVIPAGDSIQLQPSGLHLMIMGTNKEAFAGESISIDFHFESGAMFTASLPIKSMHSGH